MQEEVDQHIRVSICRSKHSVFANNSLTPCDTNISDVWQFYVKVLRPSCQVPDIFSRFQLNLGFVDRFAKKCSV
jgi:hypothetical protein